MNRSPSPPSPPEQGWLEPRSTAISGSTPSSTNTAPTKPKRVPYPVSPPRSPTCAQRWKPWPPPSDATKNNSANSNDAATPTPPDHQTYNANGSTKISRLKLRQRPSRDRQRLLQSRADLRAGPHRALEDRRRRRTGHPGLGVLAQHQPSAQLSRRHPTRRIRSHLLR